MADSSDESTIGQPSDSSSSLHEHVRPTADSDSTPPTTTTSEISSVNVDLVQTEVSVITGPAGARRYPPAPLPTILALARTTPSVRTIDPQAGAYYIPWDFIYETIGCRDVLQSKRDISLCILFQNECCNAKEHCRQLHADREFVAERRNLQRTNNDCCLYHGDIHSHTSDFVDLVSVGDEIGMIALVGETSGKSIRVPRDFFAYTTSLHSILTSTPSAKEEGDEVIPRVPVARICGLHQRKMCLYGQDCKYVHICRSVWSTILAEHDWVANDATIRKQKHHSAAASLPLHATNSSKPYQGLRSTHTQHGQFTANRNSTRRPWSQRSSSGMTAASAQCGYSQRDAGARGYGKHTPIELQHQQQQHSHVKPSAFGRQPPPTCHNPYPDCPCPGTEFFAHPHAPSSHVPPLQWCCGIDHSGGSGTYFPEVGLPPLPPPPYAMPFDPSALMVGMATTCDYNSCIEDDSYPMPQPLPEPMASPMDLASASIPCNYYDSPYVCAQTNGGF